MKTFIFPGQGSQTKGMGKDLFEEFGDLTAKADEILGYSIREICLENPDKKLNQTQYTQAALYVVNALSYYKKLQETGEKPDFLAGHSLGEFNALLAAEAIDFETGLRLVKKRGELMAQATGGGMAAVTGTNKEKVEAILAENGLVNIDLANFNTPSQIVLSGQKEEIANAQEFFHQKEGMRYHPLNTSGAFHSRFMQPAKEEFEKYLREFTFSELKIPVISNVTARPYESGQVAANLAAQITSSVRWSESVQYLVEQGEMEFEEIGNGKVLSKLVAKIREETLAARGNATASQGASTPARWEEARNLPTEEKVALWNRTYPVGTKVRSVIVKDEELETRTEAVVLFGHRAAVYMKDYNGYFDLDEITPVGELTTAG